MISMANYHNQVNGVFTELTLNYLLTQYLSLIETNEQYVCLFHPPTTCVWCWCIWV